MRCEGVRCEEGEGSEGVGVACVVGGREGSDLEGSHVASSSSGGTWGGHQLE